MAYRRTVSTLAVLAALLVASCGGSSDDSGAESSVADEAGASSEEESGAESGSNEETEEKSGLDIDLDELEDSLSEFNIGEGGAIITIDGVSYEFEGQICVAFEGDLTIEGPGVTADGVPFWGRIEIGETQRSDLADAGIDDASLDSFFGDKESAVDASVQVEIGQTELFGNGPDDEPSYSASIVLDSVAEGEIVYEVDASGVTGSGQMVDENNVALEFGETAPFEFSGGCN